VSTFTTPHWSAPKNGVVNQSRGIQSGQINQLLGTHAASIIYQGNRVVLPQVLLSDTSNVWTTPLDATDVDQPFTMSGTVIGRIQFPILPVGNGADLLVSLCADSSGVPGAVITQTRIPASWIYELAAVAGVSGPSSEDPTLVYTGNTLAAPQHQIWGYGGEVILPYNYPANNFVGASANPSTNFYGGYIIGIGGVSNGLALNGVFTIPYDANGDLLPSVPQVSFPTTNDGSSATCVVIDAVTGLPVVVNSGGGVTFNGPPISNVYTASLDTSNGTLSGWSAQTALPVAIQNHNMAAGPNGYVYSVGGAINSLASLTNTVNYAQVQNGQVGAWTAAVPLPLAVQLPYVIVCNNFLVVMGGATTTNFTTSTTDVWYAPISSVDGSIGNWVAGPPLFTAAFNQNGNPFANDYGIITVNAASTIPFTASGPSVEWSQDTAGGGGFLPGYYDYGNGQVLEYALSPGGNEYATLSFTLMPHLSVPLPTTGLSNGTTYHVLIQQQGGDAANYLVTLIGEEAYGNTGPTALTSPHDTYQWTAQASHYGVPIEVYDATVPGGNKTPWHTWEDGGARVMTLVYTTAPDQRFLGVCDATTTQVGLNSNQGFENGLTPWQVFNGTVVQSSTEAYTGAYSAQVTPNGTSSQVFLQSEMLSCLPGQSITVSGWFWFTSAVTTNASLSVNWYTSVTAGSTLISTSSNSVSVPANTWTFLTNTFTAPSTPSLAYQFTINPVLGGTPSAANVWYTDDVVAYYTTVNKQEFSVAAVEWNGDWPEPLLIPLGLNELA